MKNFIISTLLVVAITTSAFATGESNVSYFVLNTFKNEFRGATNVNWTSRPEYAKATFLQDNRKMEVFYNSSGTLLAVSKTIQIDELPTMAKRTFAKRYEGYIVKEAIQFDGSEEQSFYISAENDKENLVIKVDGSAHVSVFKRTRK